MPSASCPKGRVADRIDLAFRTPPALAGGLAPSKQPDPGGAPNPPTWRTEPAPVAHRVSTWRTEPADVAHRVSYWRTESDVASGVSPATSDSLRHV